MTLRIERRQPGNPGFLQFCMDRVGDLRVLTRHGGNSCVGHFRHQRYLQLSLYKISTAAVPNSISNTRLSGTACRAAKVRAILEATNSRRYLRVGCEPSTLILVRDQDANGAILSSRVMISSRVRSGIARMARWIPASRYSASTAWSAGAANTLIDSVEKSDRPPMPLDVTARLLPWVRSRVWQSETSHRRIPRRASG